jgi:ElaB/YqjD/DUF883 family membrane-anchored ribosome-binding protein
MNDIGLDTAQVRDARDKFIADLQLLTTHAQELVQATRSLSGDAVKLARDKLDESLSVSRQQLAQFRQTAEQRSRAAAGELDEHLRTHPRESVAVVALASLAVGWLSRGAAAGTLNNLARLAAIGIAGAAGAVLWSFRLQSEPPPVVARRKQAAGRAKAAARAIPPPTA